MIRNIDIPVKKKNNIQLYHCGIPIYHEWVTNIDTTTHKSKIIYESNDDDNHLWSYMMMIVMMMMIF